MTGWEKPKVSVSFQNQNSFTDRVPALSVTSCSFGRTSVATQTELNSLGSSVSLLNWKKNLEIIAK